MTSSERVRARYEQRRRAARRRLRRMRMRRWTRDMSSRFRSFGGRVGNLVLDGASRLRTRYLNANYERIARGLRTTMKNARAAFNSRVESFRNNLARNARWRSMRESWGRRSSSIGQYISKNIGSLGHLYQQALE